MSKLWLVIDVVITSPFYIIGYTASAGAGAIKQGWCKYQENLAKAHRDEL